MIKISVVHATARVAPPYPSFPRGWLDSVEAFAAKCDSPEEIEYILVVHESNWNTFWLKSPASPRWDKDGFGFGSFRVVRNTGRNCCVDQANTGAAAATGVVIVGGMDDLFPLSIGTRWFGTLSGTL